MSQNIVFSFPCSVFICLIFYIFPVFSELGLSKGAFSWVEKSELFAAEAGLVQMALRCVHLNFSVHTNGGY